MLETADISRFIQTIMTGRLSALLPGALACIIAPPLAAQDSITVEPDLPPAEFRIAPPGTTMIWTRLDGYKTEHGRIGEAEDMLVHYSWEDRPQQTYLFCIGCDPPYADFDLAAYKAIFPLEVEVGKAVEFPRRVDQWHWTNRIAVVGTETLQLPFGAVDAFIIESETRGLDNPFHARNRVWFAPGIGWNVRFQYQDSRGVSYAWQALVFKPPVTH